RRDQRLGEQPREEVRAAVNERASSGYDLQSSRQGGTAGAFVLVDEVGRQSSMPLTGGHSAGSATLASRQSDRCCMCSHASRTRSLTAGVAIHGSSPKSGPVVTSRQRSSSIRGWSAEQPRGLLLHA